MSNLPIARLNKQARNKSLTSGHCFDMGRESASIK